MTEDKARAIVSRDVSRETLDRLDVYVELLRKWQPKVNLVSNKTLPEVWNRHILDSFQVLKLADVDAAKWVDLGSGGGFPGLVCAICARDVGLNSTFHLIESDTRKCAFLREVARQTATQIEVTTSRIEEAAQSGASIVSARALAPLARLLPWAHRHLMPGGTALFQKGASYRSELETVRGDWQMDLDVEPSVTAPDSVILRIRNLAHA